MHLMGALPLGEIAGSVASPLGILRCRGTLFWAHRAALAPLVPPLSVTYIQLPLLPQCEWPPLRNVGPMMRSPSKRATSAASGNLPRG